MLLKKTNFIKQLGINLVKIGLGLVVIGMSWQIKQKIVFSGSEIEAIKVVENPRPIRILIPKVNLDLEIEESEVKSDVWEVADEGVSHWQDSVNPGEVGNMVIYGHNHNYLFGPIRWLEVNDKIYVMNEKNQMFDYEIKKSLVVKPDEIELLLPTDSEQLTIYTCTGKFDSMRHVVMAEPVR